MWLRAADAAAALLLLLTLWVLVTGGARGTIAGVRLSATSPERLAFAAAAVIAVRHALRPRPSMRSTIRAVRPLRLPADWKAVAPIWAASRFGVLAIGFFAVLLIGNPDARHAPRISDSALGNLPARWDAFWYLDIAVNGYRWVNDPLQMQNVAFFPAFPWSMRAGGLLLGAYSPGIRRPDAHRRMMWGGWLAALAAFWAALVFVYRWAETRAGPRAALATVTLLAVYPFAVYFSAPYSEPLYLLGVTAAFVHVERGAWLRAGAWGFLAALIRPTGVLLIVPLAWIALSRHWRNPPSTRTATVIGLALAAPVLAILLHSLTIYQLTGRPFAWSEVQAAWGRTYQVTTWLGTDLARMAEQGVLDYVEGSPVVVLNASAALFAGALLWTIARRAGIAYALFVIVNLVPALLSGGLMSVGRFTSTLFPLFFALATLVPERHLTTVIVAFSLLQGLLATLFFTWRAPF